MEKQPRVRHAVGSDAGRSFQPMGGKSPRRAVIIREQRCDCGRVIGLWFGCVQQCTHPGAATLHQGATGFTGRIIRAITLATGLCCCRNLCSQVGRRLESRGPKQGHSQQKREKEAKQCSHSSDMTQAAICGNTRPVDATIPHSTTALPRPCRKSARPASAPRPWSGKGRWSHRGPMRSFRTSAPARGSGCCPNLRGP